MLSPSRGVVAGEVTMHQLNRSKLRAFKCMSACSHVFTSVTSTILAQSGSQGIFVNPKTNDSNSIDPSFAIIWLKDKDRTQALEDAKKIPEQAGLVLPFKGKRGYGLRVPSSVYEEAQGLLNPSNPKQAHIPATCYVKLSPLPHGVTQDDIRTWLEKQALRMRPIRSLAANTWLLAAGDKVEACHYLWGRSTVLIAPVSQNPVPKPTISAGGIRNTSSKSTSITASSSSEPAIKDNWDPWANWNPHWAMVPQQLIILTHQIITAHGRPRPVSTPEPLPLGPPHKHPM